MQTRTREQDWMDEELLLDDLPGAVPRQQLQSRKERAVLDVDEDELFEIMSPEEAAFMIGVTVAQAGGEYNE